MQINYYNPLTNYKEKEKELNISEVIQLFDSLPSQEDSFLKINDTDQELIYRFIHTKNQWMIDHPVVQGTLHKQRYATKNECNKVINKIYKGVLPDKLNGFIDVPKGFTLDDMLEFKREDEMMLRGQDPDLHSDNQPKALTQTKEAPVTPQTPTPKPLSEKATVTKQKPTVQKDIKPTTHPKTPKPTTDNDSLFSL